MASPRTQLPPRRVPERVVLPVRPGHEPSGAPPVRIFLGSEASQFRPERVLVWSIEQVRDPSRVYEIHLLKELEGFDRSRWTTGFTNYRFAIPHFAGGRGRAIYNDEDQIYLTDPAELFDLPMDGRGFLAISETESSVMLIDCERMAPHWTLDAARTGRKKALLAGAVGAGLLGPLDSHWNARDGEYREGRSHLLHYTTLHTQPWRPFPERFVYRDNPLGHLWYALERGADAEGFGLFGRAQPSSRFAAARERVPASDALVHPGLVELIRAAAPASVQAWDPRSEPDGKRADAVVCSGGLESMPEDDVPWLLDELFECADRFVFVAVDCSDVPTRIAPTETETRTAPDRWRDHFEAASRRRPGVHWDLIVARRDSEGHAVDRYFAAGPRFDPQPPTVWIAAGPGPEHAESARALADALGWPARRLDGQPNLAPPWPELLIASGPETASTIETVRERSQGRTRIVAIDVGAGATDVDLAVAPVSAGLFAHPKRFEVATPLVVPSAREPAELPEWRDRFATAPAPRIAVFVEAGRAPYRVGASDARRLGSAVREAAGSDATIFAVCDPSLQRALRDGAGAPIELCSAERGEPAYRAHLAHADRIVVTGNAERVIADACATGAPVEIFPVRRRGGGPSERLRAAVARLADGAPQNNRGTVRPQQGLERFCSRLIASGAVRPPRDLEAVERNLVERGIACAVGAQPSAQAPRVLDEAGRVAERVRRLLGVR